jgi:hypothetical protein
MGWVGHVAQNISDVCKKNVPELRASLMKLQMKYVLKIMHETVCVF